MYYAPAMLLFLLLHSGVLWDLCTIKWFFFSQRGQFKIYTLYDIGLLSYSGALKMYCYLNWGVVYQR